MRARECAVLSWQHWIVLSTDSQRAEACGHWDVLMENVWHLEWDSCHISGMVYFYVFMDCLLVATVFFVMKPLLFSSDQSGLCMKSDCCCVWKPCGLTGSSWFFLDCDTRWWCAVLCHCSKDDLWECLMGSSGYNDWVKSHLFIITFEIWNLNWLVDHLGPAPHHLKMVKLFVWTMLLCFDFY